MEASFIKFNKKSIFQNFISRNLELRTVKQRHPYFHPSRTPPHHFRPRTNCRGLLSKPGGYLVERWVRGCAAQIGCFFPGRGSQIWNGYGCKGRAQTSWGIQWEHRLKKWGVIGWEHDFWHSVREKYKNMWGHRVRAKISQKISQCWIVKSLRWIFSHARAFSNHGALSDRLNAKIWVFGCELWTVKKYGVYGCQRCWKRGSFDPYIRVASRMGLPPRGFFGLSGLAMAPFFIWKLV